MARARNIKPGVNKNELLAECPYQVRYLFVSLPMYADREGRLEDRPRRIKAEVFPLDDITGEQLSDMLQQLADRGFIERYEVDGCKYIQIVNFLKHQRPHHKETVSEIPANRPGKVVASTDLGTSQPLNSGASCALTDSLLSDSPIPHPSCLNPDTPSDKTAGPEPPDPFIEEFVSAWNSTPGTVKAQRITDKRVTSILARSRERPWRAQWREALAKFPLKMTEDGGWQPDIEWFTKPDSVMKILEGKYDWSKSNGKSQQRLSAGKQYDPSARADF